jgi:hypothetical protein
MGKDNKGHNGKSLILPRLFDVHQAALYAGVGQQTIRDWTAEGILCPVKVPGSRIRRKDGLEIIRSNGRSMRKLLYDRADIDALIDAWKAQSVIGS